MPKKPAAAEALTDAPNTDVEPDKKLPQQIDLSDATAIKHKLDETAADVSIQCKEEHEQRMGPLRVHCVQPPPACWYCWWLQVVLKSGYTEDHLISNVKNALGIFA
jgi:hypothetical protein